MLPDLATPRLRLTPITPDELDLLRELNADEAVMRHLTGRPASPAETDVDWDDRLGSRSDSSREPGYWAGRNDGAFVGWWGLGACS